MNKKSLFIANLLVVFASSLLGFDPLFTSSETNIECKQLGTPKSITVVDAVGLAICNNPTAKIAVATMLDKAAGLGIARSDYLPTISATGNISQSKSSANTDSSFARSIGAEITYNLYDFGAREAKNNLAKELFESASASKDATIQTLFSTTVKYFYQALAAKQALIAAKDSETYAQASFEAAQKKYEVGVSTKADLLQAKTSLSNAKLATIKAEGDLKNSNARLLSTIALEPNSTLETIDGTKLETIKSLETSLEELIKIAKSKRPEIISSTHDIKIAEENIYLAKSEFMPSIMLRGSSQYSDTGVSSQGRNSSAIISVNIPIFSGFSSLYTIKSAKEKLKIAVAQKENQENTVALEVVTAYQNLLTSTKSLDASTDLEVSADESYKMALGRYKAGVGSMIELLSAQSSLAEAKKIKISSLYDWHTAKVELSKSLGELSISQLKQ